MKPRFLLAGIASAVFSSLAWVSEQEAVLKLSPLLVSAIAPLLAAFVIIAGNPLKPAIVSLREIRRHLPAFLQILFIRNILAFLVFTYALTFTSSAKVMFLTKVEPYIVLAIHCLRDGERVSKTELALLAVHVLGAILLSTGWGLSIDFEQVGDLLVLLGLLASASVYKPGKLLAEAWGPRRSTATCSLYSGLILLPVALYLDAEKLNPESPDFYPAVFYLLVTVLLYYVFSTVFWFYSLQGLKAWLNSALRCLGPLVAAPLAYFLFEKTLDSLQILGASLVVLTSLGLIGSSKRDSA